MKLLIPSGYVNKIYIKWSEFSIRRGSPPQDIASSRAYKYLKRQIQNEKRNPKSETHFWPQALYIRDTQPALFLCNKQVPYKALKRGQKF